VPERTRVVRSRVCTGYVRIYVYNAFFICVLSLISLKRSLSRYLINLVIVPLERRVRSARFARRDLKKKKKKKKKKGKRMKERGTQRGKENGARRSFDRKGPKGSLKLASFLTMAQPSRARYTNGITESCLLSKRSLRIAHRQLSRS